ncbi:hypothetical protein MBLNU457_5866t1 [Dothideomycetes sp. NU457]
MPSDDLVDHANSSQDFYALLGVNFETSESDIRRAYRKTALKYHPDKNADNPAALEKFHLLQIAYDVLSDPTAKGIYDNARKARKDKEERESAFEGRRRQMKDDLERRESGYFKRKRDEDDAEEALQREIKRLAEDGARRRREREERLNRELLEEEERRDQERRGEVPIANEAASKGGTEVAEIDRSVKVRWQKKDDGLVYDEDALKRLFAQFGTIVTVFLLKEKRKRLDGQKDKVAVATAVVVFSSVVGAHAAIEGSKREDLRAFDSIYWAGDAEPEFLKARTASPVSEPNTPSNASVPQKSKQRFNMPENPATPVKEKAGGGLKKVPSFANFSAASTPKATPKGTPNREELTMIRLMNAEKRRQEEKARLEEQIRKEEQG